MKALFISKGATVPAWYRCGLPAIYGEWDWAGISWNIKSRIITTGTIDNFDDKNYDVVVCQQPYGEAGKTLINEMKNKGAKVLYEIDDFIHGVRKIEHHRFKKTYNKKFVKSHEECMKMCDGLICSTEFLADQYKKYNPTTYICKVGIDTMRYEVKFPPRQHINIGWAGGTGHDQAVIPMLRSIIPVMKTFQNVGFVSIGEEYAQALKGIFDHRVLSVPWVAIENVPFALTNIDIMIAPGHESKYFKSKSDLRWLESSAVGIPTIASPQIYHDIKDNLTGYLYEDGEQLKKILYRLLQNDNERRTVGKQAQKWVHENRDMVVAKKQWEYAFSESLKTS